MQNKPLFIDVSRWQGYINWALTSRNVAGAIIKAGGSDDGFYIDSKAKRNISEARKHTVPIGLYFFLGGFFSPDEEAAYIASMISDLGGLKPGEPFVLDWEQRRPGLDEVGYLTGIVDGLSRRGFPPPLIYMSLNYVTTQNWTNLTRRNCGLWVAAWGNNDAVPDAREVPGSDEWPFWVLWQYSSTGSIPGIAGRVDLNLLNGDIDTFKKYGLQGGLSFPGTPSATPTATVPDGSYDYYKVVAGDSLSKIASRYGRKWQELYSMNRDKISDPNRIFVGQEIRVWKSAAASNPQLPTKPAPAAPEKKYHTVVSGENLSVIAARYGVASWQNIYDANRNTIGADPNYILPGQRLLIP